MTKLNLKVIGEKGKRPIKNHISSKKTNIFISVENVNYILQSTPFGAPQSLNLYCDTFRMFLIKSNWPTLYNFTKTKA